MQSRPRPGTGLSRFLSEDRRARLRETAGTVGVVALLVGAFCALVALLLGLLQWLALTT